MNHGQLRIDVERPIKTDDRYEFHCHVSGEPFTRATAAYRLKSVVRGFGSPFRTTRRFGFRALNFNIRHAEVWDSVFPLMFLTRNANRRLFNRDYKAVIRFRYPVLEPVRQFFVGRAANFGLSVEVEADTFERVYDVGGKGSILAFGGGKESLLLFGLLQELGQTPKLTKGVGVDADPRRAGQNLKSTAELSSLDISKPFHGAHVERVMPGLMSGSANFYFGGTLLDVHLTRPWHQYYDLGSWQGQNELNELFRVLGVGVKMHTPVNVPPPNLVQKMLAVRYPELYAQQRSVAPGAENQKNLHVSLLKLYHNLSISPQCSDELFRLLVARFVARKLAKPLEFGDRRGQELFDREMMAIIWNLRDHPLLRDVAPQIPAAWQARWIDFLHPHVNPDVDPAMMEIFRKYASDYAPVDNEYRITTGTVAPEVTD